MDEELRKNYATIPHILYKKRKIVHITKDEIEKAKKEYFANGGTITKIVDGRKINPLAHMDEMYDKIYKS